MLTTTTTTKYNFKIYINPCCSWSHHPRQAVAHVATQCNHKSHNSSRIRNRATRRTLPVTALFPIFLISISLLPYRCPLQRPLLSRPLNRKRAATLRQVSFLYFFSFVLVMQFLVGLTLYSRIESYSLIMGE